MRVTLPLSIPGILSGSILVFVLTISALVTPRLLGGPTYKVMSTLIYEQFMSLLNWPRRIRDGGHPDGRGDRDHRIVGPLRSQVRSAVMVARRMDDAAAVRARSMALGLWVLLVYAFLLLPVVVVVMAAFSATSYLSVPPKGLTLRWFLRGAGRSSLSERNLVQPGPWRTLTTIGSLVIGIAAAYALARRAGARSAADLGDPDVAADLPGRGHRRRATAVLRADSASSHEFQQPSCRPCSDHHPLHRARYSLEPVWCRPATLRKPLGCSEPDRLTAFWQGVVPLIRPGRGCRRLIRLHHVVRQRSRLDLPPRASSRRPCP